MMDLKSFVEETLCQIAEGIHDAQTRLRGSGALINPYYHAKENGPEGSRTPKRFIPKPNCRPWLLILPLRPASLARLEAVLAWP